MGAGLNISLCRYDCCRSEATGASEDSGALHVFEKSVGYPRYDDKEENAVAEDVSPEDSTVADSSCEFAVDYRIDFHVDGKIDEDIHQKSAASGVKFHTASKGPEKPVPRINFLQIHATAANFKSEISNTSRHFHALEDVVIEKVHDFYDVKTGVLQVKDIKQSAVHHRRPSIRSNGTVSSTCSDSLQNSPPGSVCGDVVHNQESKSKFDRTVVATWGIIVSKMLFDRVSKEVSGMRKRYERQQSICSDEGALARQFSGDTRRQTSPDVVDNKRRTRIAEGRAKRVLKQMRLLTKL